MSTTKRSRRAGILVACAALVALPAPRVGAAPQSDGPAPTSFELCRDTRAFDGSTRECVSFVRGCAGGIRHSRRDQHRGPRSSGSDPDGAVLEEVCNATAAQCRGLAQRFTRALAQVAAMPRTAAGREASRRPEGGATLTLTVGARAAARHVSEPAGRPLSTLLDATLGVCH
jgi:hypothetical protein